MATVGQALVTGAAGFIGFHVTRNLLEVGTRVVGVADPNDYYDPRLKEARIYELRKFEIFELIKLSTEAAGCR